MDESHFLNALSERVQAEIERTNEERKRREVEEQRLEETRRLRVIQQRHAKTLEQIVERYAQLGEMVTGLVHLLHQYLDQQNSLAGIREWLEELSERYEDLERELDGHFDIIEGNQRLLIRLLQISLSGGRRNDNRQEVDGLIQKAEERLETISLRKQLAINQRRLMKLKEQKSAYGSDAPARLIIDIEDCEAEVKDLERQLEALKS